MKDTLIDLKTRRSCRNYKPEQITDDELNAVLEAGTYAPTGRGMQAPVMVVIQNKDLISKLSKMNADIMGVDTDPFYGAPTLIIVFADKRIGTYIEDGSLVMGNLMNAAHAIGLGSCWIHRAREVFQTDEGKALLLDWGLDENYEGIGNCILGYVVEEAPLKPRKSNYIIKVK